MLTYLAMGFIRKHVHVQAVVASLACFLYELVSAAPTVLTEKLRMICGGDANDIHISALIILSLILSKHIEPVYKLLNKQSS